jgi:hypothetical protein
MSWLPSAAAIGEPVTLYEASDSARCDSRLDRSSGTYRVGPDEVEEWCYEQQACLPRKPWVALTSVEKRGLIASTKPAEIWRSIYVMKAPGGLLECAARLSRQRSNNHREAPNRASSSRDHQECAAEIRGICSVTGELHFLGLQIDQPGLETVTLSDDTRRLPGLHVDSWDDVDIGRRRDSRNRMSVNVGSTPRFLLFVPLVLQDVAAYVEKASGTPVRQRGDQTPLARQFMALHPEIPVVRCRIDPGELYIAPTENIIHDGSSADTSQLGRSFAVLGRMSPK